MRTRASQHVPKYGRLGSTEYACLSLSFGAPRARAAIALHAKWQLPTSECQIKDLKRRSCSVSVGPCRLLCLKARSSATRNVLPPTIVRGGAVLFATLADQRARCSFLGHRTRTGRRPDQPRCRNAHRGKAQAGRISGRHPHGESERFGRCRFWLGGASFFFVAGT